LQKTFHDLLGLKFFEKKVHTDQSYQDLQDLVQRFIKSPDAENAEYIIIVIMSHGDETEIVCADAARLSVKWLLEQFSNQEAKKLRGKLKNVILNSCRYSEN
jgi:hypothetical protein